MPQGAKRTKGLTVQSNDAERDELVALADALRGARESRGKGRGREEITISVADRHLPVPRSVVEFLEGVTRRLAAGDDVTVFPTQEELTTGEAARLLNVSRQYLVRLCNEGKLPCRKEGTHRRLSLTDVLAFRELRDKERSTRFRQFIRDSFEDGEYDDAATYPPQ